MARRARHARAWQARRPVGDRRSHRRSLRGLIRAKETSIRLVMINGVARYGMPALMKELGPKTEAIRVGGRERRVFLEQETADPAVSAVSLSEARAALSAAFRDLPNSRASSRAPSPCGRGRFEPRACNVRPAGAGCVVPGARRNQAHRGRPASAPSIQRTARFHRTRHCLARSRRPALEHPSTNQLDPLTVADDKNSWPRSPISRMSPRRCVTASRRSTDFAQRL